MSARLPASRPTLAFAGTFLGVLVAFRALDVLVARLGQLPASAYAESLFLDDLIGRWAHLITSRAPSWLPVAVVGVVVAAIVVDARRLGGAGRRRLAALFGGWNELDEGNALRWLVLGVTGVATWALSCYARNLYLDQLHVADRLVIVVLWVAIAWRPIFALPFAVAATAVAGQFVVPLGFISWTEMGVVLRFPVLVAAFWIVRTVTRRRQSDVFVFAWCCLLAATYWTSGLGKLRVGWLTHPHVHLLLLGAYANGWLSSLDPKTVERAARVIASLAWPLMLFTLVVECGSLVMLWRRWVLVGFFVLAGVFHLGAFAMTGIFFWKWILIDAMLLVYLLRGRRLTRMPIFTGERFAMSVLAILASPVWVPSENLTWFDTPLTYSLELEGVDARGAVHALPAGFFRPYSEAIVLGASGATPPHPKLTRGMGVTMDRTLASVLESARSADAVFAIERARGIVRADSAASAAFDDFVGTYAANARCATERDPLLLRVIGVPRHLWTLPLDAALPCDVRLERVRVVERTTFFDGTALRVVRRIPLREIAVAARADTVRR
jgi:hypothetical protein